MEKPTRRNLLLGAAVAGATGSTGIAAGYVAGRGGLVHAPAAHISEFARRAAEVRHAQSQQTSETVAFLRKKYMDPVIGQARVWDMIEKLGMCVDVSDNSLMLTSQFLHVQQILEGMEQDGVADRDLFMVALLHDIGKIMLLAGEAPEHVVGYLEPVNEPKHGAGLENVVFQFGHDEFAWSRLKDHVPEHIAWTIRYHSARVGTIQPYCNRKELEYLDGCLAKFQPYDLGRKSYSHMPKVDMAKYRAIIEDAFPQPILF